MGMGVGVGVGHTVTCMCGSTRMQRSMASGAISSASGANMDGSSFFEVTTFSGTSAYVRYQTPLARTRHEEMPGQRRSPGSSAETSTRL